MKENDSLLKKEQHDSKAYGDPFHFMKKWLEAYFSVHEEAKSEDQVMNWIHSQPMQGKLGK